MRYLQMVGTATLLSAFFTVPKPAIASPEKDACEQRCAILHSDCLNRQKKPVDVCAREAGVCYAKCPSL